MIVLDVVVVVVLLILVVPGLDSDTRPRRMHSDKVTPCSPAPLCHLCV